MDLHAENGALARILRAGGLVLRPIVAADAPAIIASLNTWDVSRWLTMVPYPYSRDDADWWIAQADQSGHWAIDVGDGLIGVISIKPDMGFWMAPAQQGMGLMTKAARAVVAEYFRFSDVPLASGHYPDNAASRAVLHKLGFTDTHLETHRQVSTGHDVPVQRMLLAKDAFRG